MPIKKKKPSLGKMLSIMSRSYQQHMLESLKPLGLNMTGLAVIMGLSTDPGMSLNEFSKVKRINKALLSKTLHSMQKDCFVNIETDPNHKQRVQLFLTQKAQQLAPQLKKLLATYEKTALGSLSPEERLQLLALLEQVYEKL